MRFVLAASLLLVVAAPAASADPPGAATVTSMEEEARERFARGQELFASGDYRGAIAEFRAAYDLTGYPELLLNIGQGQRLGGFHIEALETYRRFLELVPDHEFAEEVREHVAALERRLLEEEDRRRPQAPSGEPNGPDALVTVERDTVPDERSSGGTLRVAGVATAVLGIVALGAGAKFAFDVRRIDGQLSDHEGAWTDELLGRAHRGRRAERNMVAGFAVGGAATVAGAVLYLLGRRAASGEERGGPDLVPGVDPTGTVSVSIEGRF